MVKGNLSETIPLLAWLASFAVYTVYRCALVSIRHLVV